MKSLAHAPQFESHTIDEFVDFEGETYEFSILVRSFADMSSVFESASGEHQGSLILSRLVVFKDDEGKTVPLSYEAARRLPPKLGVAIQKKALQANGFGEDSAKN